jgi:hypothetical protein
MIVGLSCQTIMVWVGMVEEYVCISIHGVLVGVDMIRQTKCNRMMVYLEEFLCCQGSEDLGSPMKIR